MSFTERVGLTSTNGADNAMCVLFANCGVAVFHKVHAYLLPMMVAFTEKRHLEDFPRAQNKPMMDKGLSD